MRSTSRLWTAALAIGALTACKSDKAASAVPPVAPASQPASRPARPSAARVDTARPADPAAMAEAGALYTSRCAPCHGLSGHGDGPLAKNLDPRPRTFDDAKWQSLTADSTIEKIIREGGPSMGKSPIMPASPDLVDRPEVVRALRLMVRAFFVPPQ